MGAIRRLVGSLCRFLWPEDAARAEARLESPALHFVRSVPLGGAYLLRKLWERLGLEKVLTQALKEREFVSPVEGAIFAMVSNRALAPDSRRGVEEWVREDVALGNPEPLSLQHLYRAMDFLLDHEEALQKEVFFATADLLFFDTTSVSMEWEEEGGIRRYGPSKDKRPDLPQVVVGLAVTKEGLPVRGWVLPGNTQDMTTVERIKTDLLGWKLSPCVWVLERGMSSDENKVILQRAGGPYILGEKLRDNREAHNLALSFKGRYQKVRDNLEVKEVVVGEGQRRRRLVLVYNPEQVEKDRATREKTLEYLLSTSDETLSAEDVALGYKQLIEVERAFRTLKTTLERRPIFHRKDERIRSHVLLCFVALLLVRIAERQTGETWDRIRSVRERLHRGEFSSKDGRIRRRTELTADQVNILNRLKIPAPPAFFDVRLKA